MDGETDDFPAPLSEEYLRAHTIGEPAKLSAPIRLVEYDAAWPLRFEDEAAKIRAALKGRALRVEHVGSTAVPGLPAKPVIDIVLVVADSADEAHYVPQLEAGGYRLRIREPEWHEHRMFHDAVESVNLHVFSSGCPEVELMLTFRDRLRSSGAARDLYARTKRELAARQWQYMQNYADAKTAVVRKILSA
jgi:GrpB-like predicted nucleotidyltransferase (UPF0157 family)